MPKNRWIGTAGSPVSTYNIDSQRRDIDVASDIPLLVPDATPFLVVLMRAAKESVNSMEFTWFDSEPASWWTKVETAYNDAVTEIVVEGGSIFKPKDILKNAATDEVMIIESISNDTLTVIREAGYDSVATTGTEAVAGDAGDNIMRMGNAMEENSLAPESRATQPSKEFNYVQTFRTPFAGSEDDDNESKKTSQSERIRLRKEKAIEHKLDMERALLFGERMEHINKQKRLTGGLFQFIKSKSYDVGSTNAGELTEAEFENYCEELFQYGSKKKMFICSPRVGSIINQFAAGKIETVSGDEAYGLRLKQYQSFHGDLYIVTSQTFERDYGNMGVGLDIGNIKLRPYAGHDSKLRENIQENDRLGWKDEYLTQGSLQVRLEKTHAILSGVSS